MLETTRVPEALPSNVGVLPVLHCCMTREVQKVHILLQGLSDKHSYKKQQHLLTVNMTTQ